jgi:regulator of sirC expression with transglutaminase-like and TPR domain
MIHPDAGLAEGALLIAAEEYRDLDVQRYLKQIEEMGETLRRRVRPDIGTKDALIALNHYVFDELGFRGNTEDYYDPRNSFLNDVIDRRTGIPITLSVLYMEVARRVDLPLSGVGFPGHFLVKYSDGQQEIVIDPFNGGDIKTSENLRQLLGGLYGSRVPWTTRLLDAVSKRQIVRRMLNNLKFIYLKQRDFVKALTALDRMMIADPNLAEDLRERGAVYQALECFPQAKADLENYLKLAPDAPDAGEIKEQLAALASRSTSLH